MEAYAVKSKVSAELAVLRTVTHRLGPSSHAVYGYRLHRRHYYAVSRMTRDIDLVVELSDADADRVVALFQDEFYVDLHIVHQAITIRSLSLLRKILSSQNSNGSKISGLQSSLEMSAIY
jgi:hypothetical protein